MTRVITNPEELAELASVAGWAEPFLHVEDAPTFGSRDWIELDPLDQRRAAAVVVAAWSWWCAERGYGPPPPLLDRLVVEELKRAALDVWSAADWQTLARDHLPHRVLAERRALPRTRPHDYSGGPVPLWGPVNDNIGQGRSA